MESLFRVALCKGCGGCPEIVVDATRGEVRIGEEGNLVRLSKDEWNLLVEKIHDGELTVLP